MSRSVGGGMKLSAATSPVHRAVSHIYGELPTSWRQIGPPALRPGFGRLCGRTSADTSEFCSTDRPWCPRSNPSTLVRPSNAQAPVAILSHARPGTFAYHQAVSYVVHSSFSIVLPLHVMYLGLVTGRLVTGQGLLERSIVGHQMRHRWELNRT